MKNNNNVKLEKQLAMDDSRKVENTHNDRNIFLGDSRTPSQSGILAGNCKGECWTNQDNTLAVTYSYPVGGCGVFGEIVDRKSSETFFAEVFEKLKNLGINEFEFAAEDKKLREDILELFSDRTIDSEMEYSYRISEKPAQHVGNLEGYTIEKLTKTFLEEMDKKKYKNSSMVTERLETCWQTVEDFLNQSSAFVAIKDGELAGVIFGSGRFQEFLAIDIEVAEEHRRQGIAKELALSFIDDCTARGIMPQWDCVESNTASVHLAESLGLVRIKERSIYWFGI